MGTPLFGHYTFNNSTSADIHITVVVDGHFSFPLSTSIDIEDEMGRHSQDNIEVTYTEAPMKCDFFVSVINGHYDANCPQVRRSKSLSLPTSETIHKDC